VVILGFLVFDHVPTTWTMTGAAIVIGSGLYLLYRERKRGQSAVSVGVVEGPLE
jgi:drug/metabolite transporter (DMT)-like permease